MIFSTCIILFISLYEPQSVHGSSDIDWTMLFDKSSLLDGSYKSHIRDYRSPKGDHLTTLEEVIIDDASTKKIYDDEGTRNVRDVGSSSALLDRINLIANDCFGIHKLVLDVLEVNRHDQNILIHKLRRMMSQGNRNNFPNKDLDGSIQALKPSPTLKLPPSQITERKNHEARASNLHNSQRSSSSNPNNHRSNDAERKPANPHDLFQGKGAIKAQVQNKERFVSGSQVKHHVPSQDSSLEREFFQSSSSVENRELSIQPNSQTHIKENSNFRNTRPNAINTEFTSGGRENKDPHLLGSDPINLRRTHSNEKKAKHSNSKILTQNQAVESDTRESHFNNNDRTFGTSDTRPQEKIRQNPANVHQSHNNENFKNVKNKKNNPHSNNRPNDKTSLKSSNKNQGFSHFPDDKNSRLVQIDPPVFQEEKEVSKVQSSRKDSSRLISSNVESAPNRNALSIEQFLRRYPEVRRVSSRFKNTKTIAPKNHISRVEENHDEKPTSTTERPISNLQTTPRPTRRKTTTRRRKAPTTRRRTVATTRRRTTPVTRRRTTTKRITAATTPRRRTTPVTKRRTTPVSTTARSSSDSADFDDELSSADYSYLYYQDYYDELVPPHHRFQQLDKKVSTRKPVRATNPNKNTGSFNIQRNTQSAQSTTTTRTTTLRPVKSTTSASVSDKRNPKVIGKPPPKPTDKSHEQSRDLNQVGPFGYVEKGVFFSDKNKQGFPEVIDVIYQGFVWSLDVDYGDEGKETHGGIHTILKDKVKREKIVLKKDYIIRVSGRASPFNINRLTFYTAGGKKYGPYGDRRNKESEDFDEKAPEGHGLAFISGTIDFGVPLRSVSFHWKPLPE